MKPRINLKPKGEHKVRDGHLWVFSNEIAAVDGNPVNGDMVEVYNSNGYLIGEGFYNKNSLIAVRLIDKNPLNDIYVLLQNRIKKAYSLRKMFYPNRNSFRMVFGEGDFLPGLIIDKYNKTFVLQINSSGMEINIDNIVKILKDDFNAANIFTKNEFNFRKLECLPETDSVYLGNADEEIIDDGTIKFKIDFAKSQKTGFYFDQCDNREFIEKISAGKTFLDAFSNSGGFGLHAAKAGASKITFVDSSSAEVNNAKVNFQLNNFEIKSEFETVDVFDYLNKCISTNRKFDVVSVDPPAFAKNKKSLPVAKKGYEKLNRLAFQVVSDGGYLVTSSCSQNLTKADFIDIIETAARKTKKVIQQIHYNAASFDHPQIPVMPETTYLKFLVLRVFENGNL